MKSLWFGIEMHSRKSYGVKIWCLWEHFERIDWSSQEIFSLLVKNTFKVYISTLLKKLSGRQKSPTTLFKILAQLFVTLFVWRGSAPTSDSWTTKCLCNITAGCSRSHIYSDFEMLIVTDLLYKMIFRRRLLVNWVRQKMGVAYLAL